MTTRGQTGRRHHISELSRTIEVLMLAVRKLPDCSDAAKLRGIAYRIAAAQDGSEPLPQLSRRLAAAAREALDADPWLAIDHLARRLLEICDGTLMDETTEAERASERRRNPNQEEFRQRRAEQERTWNARQNRTNEAED
jgi:hypothetical protein